MVMAIVDALTQAHLLITRIGHFIFVTQACTLFLYLHQYLHTTSRVLVLLFILRDGHVLTPVVDSAPAVTSRTVGPSHLPSHHWEKGGVLSPL